MNKHRGTLAFAAGLLVVAWVAAGYLRTHLLAFAMTLVIGAFYLAGARELQRLRRATAAFADALATAPAGPAPLGPWLDGLPVAWGSAARARLDGDRSALPGPAMTPYLAGLLVLLGMLGTFLGMVVTLNGTGAALQQAADLTAMRESLAAPVQGLGLAFGTSVAGVAASAMLGLMAAWTRRDALEASQQFDLLAATTLRQHTLAHRRDEVFRLQHAQAASLPALVDRLQALGEQLAAQEQARAARWQADQARARAGTEAAYQTLARSVEHTLQRSLTDSARAAAEGVRPVVEATMTSIATETTRLQRQVGDAVQRQLDGVAARFDAAVGSVSAVWQGSLAAQAEAQTAQAAHWRDTAETLQRALDERTAAWAAQAGQAQAAWLREQAADGARRSAESQQAWAAAAARFEQQGATLLQAVQQTQSALHESLAARDDERRSAWMAALQAMTVSMQQAWAEAGDRAAAQQARIGEALEQAARTVATEAQAHARATVAEVERLVQVAAQAPRAAAEAIAHVRAQLATSEAHDRAMLEERERLLRTLGTLLDGLDEASGRQRDAVDRLVQTSNDLLTGAAERFGHQVQAAGQRLDDVAAQLGGSAVEVASLGEAFGVAVQQFTQSGDRLIGHLKQLDETLGRSIERSDEQLAYYVAQARELIDLSLMSQKRVVDDLQRLATRHQSADSTA